MADEPTGTQPKWNVLALVAFAGSLVWIPVAVVLLLTDGHAPPAAIAAVISTVLGIGLGTVARRRIDAAPGTYRGRGYAVAGLLFGWIALFAAGGLIFWLLLPDSAPAPAP